MLTLQTGGSRTGTTDIAFTSVGGSPVNQTILRAPTDSRLLPRQIKFITNTPNTSSTNPGNARSTVRFVLGNRVESETCCDVKAGTVTVDLVVNWPLNQPDSLVDELISWLQGLAYNSALPSLIKNGVLPQ